jgi:hypothetical protein
MLYNKYCYKYPGLCCIKCSLTRFFKVRPKYMVNRAGDSLGTPVQDMREDHGRPDVFVSHKLLYGADIIPAGLFRFNAETPLGSFNAAA